MIICLFFLFLIPFTHCFCSCFVRGILWSLFTLPLFILWMKILSWGFIFRDPYAIGPYGCTLHVMFEAQAVCTKVASLSTFKVCGSGIHAAIMIQQLGHLLWLGAQFC